MFSARTTSELSLIFKCPCYSFIWPYESTDTHTRGMRVHTFYGRISVILLYIIHSNSMQFCGVHYAMISHALQYASIMLIYEKQTYSIPL